MLCGVRKDDVADLLRKRYRSLEKKELFLGFTFSKMEQMVDFANEFEQYCNKQDFLDYRNILVLLFVINEVFHRTLEQDHWLWVQELIKRKSSKI